MLDLKMDLKNSTIGLSKNRQKFYLDFDDFSSVVPGFDLLKKMKEHFPNFKCTLFTVPLAMQYFLKHLPIEKLKEWGKLVGDIDWIEIAPHGFAHQRGEWMTKNKKKIMTTLKATENLFKFLGIDFVKIFKAPYWELSKEAEEILKDEGYILAVNRNKPQIYTDIPTYVFNWSIEDKIPEYPVIKGHGHMSGTKNGIERCYPNLLKIKQNSEFGFISEYLENIWKTKRK